MLEGFAKALNGKQRTRLPVPKLLNGEQEVQLIARRLLARQVVELGIAESISHETARRTLKKTDSRVARFSTGYQRCARESAGDGERYTATPD